MTLDKIIYPNPDIPGGVVLVIPSGELSIDEVARKDVPAGVPYVMVAADDVPVDDTFFEAWEADFSNPDGYGIGADAYFAQQEASE